MTDHTYIGGVMAEMTNSIQPGCFSLIPFSTLHHQYIRNNRYILQRDRRGRTVGYVLHGAIKAGRPLHLTQVAIEYDLWEQGHGHDVIRELFRRALAGGASSILLRCAVDLPAFTVWKMMGFKVLRIEAGGRSRNRVIAVMAAPATPTLFPTAPPVPEAHLTRRHGDFSHP